jgi:peptidoglycan/LPS O-acetylase OafA/YrhL
MPLLDAVKGVACLLIAGHHFSRYGPLSESAAALAPGLFAWLSRYGLLAVQVFLVLAGFFAAASLAPDGAPRADRPLSKIFQRYARLVMPYLVALIFSVLVAALTRPWLGNEVAPGPPGIAQLVAHGLLLQDLRGYEALSAGVWYVAIDFQLFVLALAAINLSEALGRRWTTGPEQSRRLMASLLLMLVASSLAVFNRHEAFDATALYFFGSYGLGMFTFWIGRATRQGTWNLAVLALVLLGAAALALDWRSRIATALVTALAVVVIQRPGGLAPAAWPAASEPLVWLGRISYSLFLLHFPVLLLVSAAVSRGAAVTPWVGMAGLLMAGALSVGAALVLHRYIESKPVTWRGVLGLFAGLLVCGSVVAMFPAP